MPDGINMEDIYVNREGYMQITIEQEKERLRKQIDSLNEKDTEKKLELETQLSQLELIPYQKDLRGKVLIQSWFGKSLLPNSHPNF